MSYQHVTITICDECSKVLDDGRETGITEDMHTVNGDHYCEECYEESDCFMDEDACREAFKELLVELAECVAGTATHPLQLNYMRNHIALNEDYSGYTDMLCKDGRISDELYNELDAWL